MIRIISDTATLYSPSEAEHHGFHVSPLSVTIHGKNFLEYEDIDTIQFVKMIQEGYMPSSSQPSIGNVLDLYKRYPNDTIINICLSDGLSGTYQTALMAREMDDNPERITIINSKTLCGPQRHIVENAVRMADSGACKTEIIAKTNDLIEHSDSFLIPCDYNFLIRGGRLSPLVGTLGKLIRMVPIMTLSEDKKQLERFAVKRTFLSAIESIGNYFLERNINHNYKLYICHACAEDLVKKAKSKLIEMNIKADIETYLLSPVFTTHGGPGCISIQSVLI